MNKYRKGDTVIIITGKDKGKSGKIEQVLPKEKKIIVENINIIKKHVKSTSNQKGGIIEITKPIDWSKTMIIAPGSKSKTRVGFKIDKKTNEKIRVAKATGNTFK